ncbi:MAG: hypothetical protein EXS32_03580 [Opitutus sp.]|nr:hypothetical protein [Opitutus sp.]
MTTRKGLFLHRAAWLLPALALVTVGLGISAWRERGLSLGDSVYRSVALFDLGNSMYIGGPGTDWRFQAGRWTGLAVVFGTGFLALGAVLRERMALAVARKMRQEVIVIGGTEIATRAYEAARTAGKSVIWVGAPTLGVGSIRSLAFPWPPGDRATIVREYAGNAAHVLVAGDDDAATLVLARAARTTAPSASITIMMRDARLAEEAAATLNQARTRVFSVAAISARALNLKHPPFLIAQNLGQPRIHALIIGFGQSGQAMARDLMVNCRTTFLELPAITVIDPHAKALEGVMRVRAPEIDACAHFTFIEGKICSEAMAPDVATMGGAIARGGPLTACYVCLTTDTEVLGAAAMLQSLLRAVDLGRPPFFVRLGDASIVAGTVEEKHGLYALHAFGDLGSVLAASEFLSATPDGAARAFSDAYRASLPAAKRDDPTDRSARSWDELDETFREVNRAVVAHIPAKMASAGIDPSLWVGVSLLPRPSQDRQLFATEAECERLAELEHERWAAQRRMQGWRWTAAKAKDEIRRLHPFLVPYRDLSDEVKEFNRVYVRETQLACWGTARATDRDHGQH